MYEEEGLGPEALEARGDRFMARARWKRSAIFWSYAIDPTKHLIIAEDFNGAALSYVLAKTWRKAASAYGEQAISCLKGPEGQVRAAFALLDSGRCYKKIPDKDDEETAAAILALQKAAELCIEKNKLALAATCYRELAELYEEQKEWMKAMVYFQEASSHYGRSVNDESIFYARHCELKAKETARSLQKAKLV